MLWGGHIVRPTASGMENVFDARSYLMSSILISETKPPACMWAM